jgi:Bacterial Ig domain/Cadherin-like domain/Disaggregatase related repeat
MKKIIPNFVLHLFLVLISINGLFAQVETFTSGSYIINMGVVPQTVANGLKPYGLIYDLIRNNNVPIKWVISPTKNKDQADFTYNGVEYKGGTFIIPSQFISVAVNNKITASGVTGIKTTTSLTVDVSYTLTSIPKWTLDATNGSISEAFLTRAGITNTAFPGAYNFKNPQLLDCCDDFFVMPHADPTWATHSRLFSWNKDCLGTIWAGCHAVSVLENMFNPAIPSQKTNFLSVNGLVPFGSHVQGSVPYTTVLPNDPVAQFMGVTDAAHQNGSEQIFLPKAGGWRPSTNIISYDPTQANVPALSPGLAAVILYGRALGDPTRGLVMYEGGHDIGGTAPANIAAQRAFFDFSLLQTVGKVPSISVVGFSIGQIINSNSTVTGLSATATSPIPGNTFTYQWSTTCGGTFSNPTGSTTNYTAPTVGATTNCVITCKVTDNCGRATFQSFPVTLVTGPQPPVANPDAATVNAICGVGTPVTTNVLTNDTDPLGLPLTLTAVTGAVNGTVTFTPAGDVTFTPNANFAGPLVLNYTVCNNALPTPLCTTTGMLTITLASAVTPATANDAFTIEEDAIGTFNILANDAGGLSVIGITADPANGKVSINTDNTITYVPDVDFAGINNFTYRVTNGAGGFNTATVTVTVTDDGCDGGTSQSTPPSIVNTTITTTKSTLIYQGSNTRNYGNCNVIEVEGDAGFISRSLIDFDLSSIPSGATITSATLRLVHFRGFGEAGDPMTLNIKRLTKAWVEGTACDVAQAGSATWNSAGGSNWTTAGGDFASTIYGSFIGAAADADGTVYNSNILTLINEWKNGTFSNFGLILDPVDPNGGDDWFDMASDDNATVANRPQLIISYTVPAVCSALPTRAPLAMPDEATTPNGVPVNIATSTNDYFPVAGALTYTILTPPASGTATIDAAGVITYTPVGTFNGLRTLTYEVTHTASGLKDQAVVYITIIGGVVTANDDSPAGVLSGVVQTIDVKANDTHPDFVPLTTAFLVTIVTPPSNGSATVDGTGQIIYTPNAGFTGTDMLSYQVCSPTSACGSPSCDIAILNLVVNNRPPVGNNDTKTILACIANTINIGDNDTDPENNALTYTIVTPPATGTLINNNDGTVTYTPAPGFLGLVTFSYSITDNGVLPQTTLVNATVNITVNNPPNTAPIALDDAVVGNANEEQFVSVLDNDSDPEGQNLTLPVITVAPLHGTATVTANGLIYYVPFPGYSGTDVLTYQICDQVINSNTCMESSGLCDTAILNIVLNAEPCFLEIGGRVYLGPVNTNGVTGTPLNGSIAPLLYMTLWDGATKIGVQQIDANGYYKFIDLAPSTYKIVLGDNSAGNFVASLPSTYISIKEGGLVINSMPLGRLAAQGDGAVGSETTIVVDCNNITYEQLRIAATASYLNNDFQINTAAPLPIDLINFSGKQLDEQINLTWKIANEKEFSHFEIQKGVDAKELAVFTNVKGAGADIHNTIDTSPIEGINYYRLKMVDLDGSSKLSNIIQVNFEKGGSYISVENPENNGEFKVMTNLKNPRFTLLSTLGTKVEMNVIVTGNNNFTIKAVNSVAGVYYLNIVSDGKLVTKKLLIP